MFANIFALLRIEPSRGSFSSSNFCLKKSCNVDHYQQGRVSGVLEDLVHFGSGSEVVALHVSVFVLAEVGGVG